MEWIVTDDIRRETWRRLYEFANVEMTVEFISRLHGAAKSGSSLASNYQKQALQVRACVLQAKEYFDAAEASTLYTSPNHAYYGAVSLSLMMMLLLGDGRQALDMLRQDSENKHHGLFHTANCTAKAASRGLTLIEQSRVRIAEKGHFANWYRTLPPNEYTYGRYTERLPGAVNRSYRPVGQYSLAPFASLVGKQWAILDLLKYFPDLDTDFYRAGVDFPRTRTEHQIEKAQGGGVLTNTWFIHSSASVAHRDAVLSRFSVDFDHVDSLTSTFSGDELTGMVALSCILGNPDIPPPKFKFPNSRETLNHTTISYGEENIDTSELVDMYLVSYQLSMMSRYFPDVWTGCVESNCIAARLISRAVDLIKQKLPMLVLSTVTPGGVTVSTHMEPWRLA